MSNKKTARVAGMIYLLVVITGMFSLGYVPSKLIVWENASATFQNIKTSVILFKWSIVSSVLCYIFFLLLPLVLYRLFKQVNSTYATLMVVLAMVSVPISFNNIQNKFSVLSLVSGDDYLQVFGSDQLQAKVMFYLNQYDNGILILQVFWGLWLLPFGLLVYRSGFLPKILGILLMAGCVGYLVNFFGNVLIPGYSEAGISGYIRLPATLGEIGTCLWLLVVGAKETKATIPGSS